MSLTSLHRGEGVISVERRGLGTGPVVKHVTYVEEFGVAIINAKFQIRQRRYQQCKKPPNFKSTNAAINLT